MAELWSVRSEWSEIPPLDAPTNGWWALSGQWSSEEKFPRSSTARGSRQWAVAVLTAAIPLLWVHCPPAAHIGQPVWSEVENSPALPLACPLTLVSCQWNPWSVEKIPSRLRLGL